MISVFALDTNIYYHAHGIVSADKASISRALIALPHFISSQVVSEYINILQKRIAIGKHNILSECLSSFTFGTIVPVLKETLIKANNLVARYQLQIFDAIIVASALEAGCDILYSEDMQHNQLIEGKLRIINPFA